MSTIFSQKIFISGNLLLIGKKVINVNNKSKLESITDYYLRFVVELLFKCCGCSITQLFIEDQKKKKQRKKN